MLSACCTPRSAQKLLVSTAATPAARLRHPPSQPRLGAAASGSSRRSRVSFIHTGASANESLPAATSPRTVNAAETEAAGEFTASRGATNGRIHDQASASASTRRLKVQHKLAHIEATKGGHVSQFLTDSFGREHDYLRISLTEKCNLRCTYCMPEQGAQLSPKEHLLTTDEIVQIARIFVSNGVRKIRLTGGEPTVRRDLVQIVERLSALGLDALGMTSNGIALARKLPALVQAGLTHLNISLDTLDEHKFELMTRRRGHSAVINAIRSAAESLRPRDPLSSAEAIGSPCSSRRLKSLKINTVVIRGLNDMEAPAFVELTRDLPISVRFIEYMPFSDNRWSTTKLVPSSELLSNISSHYHGSSSGSALSPAGASASSNSGMMPLRPSVSDTAREYRIDGFAGSFGFISSMTDHFCSGCSRLRLGADGSMKVCLFGEPTVSLRDLLRSGADEATMQEAVGRAVKKKHFAHDGKSAGNRHEPYRTSRHHLAVTIAVLAKYIAATFKSTGGRGILEADLNRKSVAAIPPCSISGRLHHRHGLIHEGKSQYMEQDRRAWLPRGTRSISTTAVPCSQNSPLKSRLTSSSPERSSSSSSSDPAAADQSSKFNAEHRLTHISSETGKPTMVSVVGKAATSRSATAVGDVYIPLHLYELLAGHGNGAKGGRGHQGKASEERTSKKGDVFTVAQLAGIMGAKQTSNLIPLCHPLNLANVHVQVTLLGAEEYDEHEVASSSPSSASAPAASQVDTINQGQKEEGGGGGGGGGAGHCIRVTCTAECNGPTGVEMEALTGVSVACLTIWDMCKAVAGKEMLISDVRVVHKSGGKSGDWSRTSQGVS